MHAADINNIVVAGAGTMGASMAQIFAKYGCNVILYDIAEARGDMRCIRDLR